MLLPGGGSAVHGAAAQQAYVSVYGTRHAAGVTHACGLCTCARGWNGIEGYECAYGAQNTASTNCSLVIPTIAPFQRANRAAGMFSFAPEPGALGTAALLALVAYPLADPLMHQACLAIEQVRVWAFG